MSQTRENRSSFRCQLADLLLGVLVLGLLVAAALRFAWIATQPLGMLAGGLVFAVGSVVGYQIAHQNSTRMAIQVISFIVYLGLVNGWIKAAGDELTMFAILCASAGLLSGATYRGSRFHRTSDDVEDFSRQ